MAHEQCPDYLRKTDEHLKGNTMGKNIILTGDRPTGRLHLGHYVGSLKRRVELQNSGKYDEINILIADDQALTDNADNPRKIRDNIVNVVLDYLSVGIDPAKTTICVQSALPALHALTFYYLNMVTTARLSRNQHRQITTVREAINMAKYAPAACNRQAYRVHVYKGEEKTRVLRAQGSAGPFSEDAEMAIIITGDMNRYYSFEQHLMLPDTTNHNLLKQC